MMLNSATATANHPFPGPPHFVDLHVNPGKCIMTLFFSSL